jgi:outer membrane protein assembly factor BamE (lipoprotein component of BamABCDE complex)
MKRVDLVSVMLVALATTSLLLVQPQASRATNDEVTELRQRNAELEKKVIELEALLKECRETESKQLSGDQGYQNKKNWRTLELGMKEDRVEEILGHPLKVIKGVKTLWYYPNIYGSYVSFDEKGRLTGWNEP